MAQSLFDKVRVSVLGRLHSLVDEVANTPDAYKQRIRDLEMALADLRAAVDESSGTANGYRRQIDDTEGRIASMQADIDLLLGDDDPTNDEAALDLQVSVEELQGQLTQYNELLSSATANTTALNNAVTQLQNKHGEMVRGLQRITLTAAATSAKSRAAEAAEAALAASDAANTGTSIDSIAERINHDADVADARFSRVIGNLDTGTSPERAAKLARAKAALAARRKKIAGAATSTA